MTIRDRQERLLKLVETFPLKINIIANLLGVSINTIRLDISYLSSCSKIKIIKGKRLRVVAA